MYHVKNEVHESAIEARGGTNVPGMTTVLFASLGLAIIVLGAVWLFWA
jgi:hypothetical protein